MPRPRIPIAAERLRCAECAADVSQRHIELNGKLEVVCKACYLANPPQADIDCAVMETARASLKRQLHPRKLSKAERKKVRMWTDRLMGREVRRG